mmetsp:Transcript_40285/g.106874  ORF Transcript_40285/g.106874 Transcript_40285/m.106874 type:complete len:204 (+) Transcript_40285:647-1258(+)
MFNCASADAAWRVRDLFKLHIEHLPLRGPEVGQVFLDLLQSDVRVARRNKFHRTLPHFGAWVAEPLHRQLHCGLQRDPIPALRLHADLSSEHGQQLQTGRVHSVVHAFLLRRSQQMLRGELRSNCLTPRKLNECILRRLLHSRICVAETFHQKRKHSIKCRLNLLPAQGTSLQERLAKGLLKRRARKVHLYILVWDRALEDSG